MTFVIAEAGCNHGGDVGQAYLLADAAKEAGADAVKFQHFNSIRLWGDLRIERLELLDAEMAHVAFHCKAIGIEFMCTPFGIPEVEFLKPIVKRWKVASGCLEKWGLLEAIRDTEMPVIMSTGMADITRIDNALKALGYYYPARYKQAYSLLHCVSSYPCRIEDANLAAMDVLSHHHGDRCEIGYSDHTNGITVAIAAVARGAKIIEKHLTLDRNQDGPDHKTSIEPNEFRVMVSAIRTVEQAIGKWGEKQPRECEAKVMEAWYP